MLTDSKEFQSDSIEPATGDLTKYVYPSVESDNPNVKSVSLELCKLLDGLTARKSGLRVSHALAYAQASPKEYDQYPYVGLKIHVAIPWNDPNFLKMVESVALLCESKNIDGRTTMFKVVYPSVQEKWLAEGESQGNKSITIYPRYLNGDSTNVAETVRFVSNLKNILRENGISENDFGADLSKTERRSASNIYLRAGALKERGDNFEHAGRNQPFDIQLEKNLDSPGTNSQEFKKLINQAISKGEL